MTTIDEWREIGREQGEVAGSNQFVFQDEESWTRLEPFLTGHVIHEGVYTLVRRHVGDFPSDEHCEAWMAGVIAGISSSGAWLGYLCSIEGIPSGLKSGKHICVFVTQHPSTMGFKPD